MCQLNGVAVREVRDGAGNFQTAVDAAAAPAEFGRGFLQQGGGLVF